MRFALISLVCAACGGKTLDSHVLPGPMPEITEFPALRFAPDAPTYLVTAPSVRAVQGGIRGFIDAAGILIGLSSEEAGRGLASVLTIDPLSEAGAKQLGIDPDGSIALFSEATDPTIVVKLSDASTTTSFFDAVKQRAKTTSIITDGVEVTTAKIERSITASWAIDHDTLWVHFAFGFDKDGDWFTPTHHPKSDTWRVRFATLKSFNRMGVLGFIDTQQLLAMIQAKAKGITTCADAFRQVGLASFSITVDGSTVGGKLALELGSSADGLTHAILAPPAGFETIARGAPLAAQWNLDLLAIQKLAGPCLASIGGNADALTRDGIRTVRAIVQTFDPSGPSGTGVVSADLTKKDALAKYLDMIPRRSLFESDQRYGHFVGKRVKIPFVISIDYILDDARAMLAIGDGLMETLVAGTPGKAPLASIDLDVSAMKPEAWQFLIAQATNSYFAERALARLLRWQRGHLRVTVDHTQLVIEATGTRK